MKKDQIKQHIEKNFPKVNLNLELCNPESVCENLTGFELGKEKILLALIEAVSQKNAELSEATQGKGELSISFQTIATKLETQTITLSFVIYGSKKFEYKVTIEDPLKITVTNVDKFETATNGEEAIAKFNSFKPTIILMDGQMPKMDGITATQKIREEEKDKQDRSIIIGLSGNNEVNAKEKWLNAGADDFKSKPIKAEALLTTLRIQIEKRAIMSENLTTHQSSTLS
jgi:CheY-like chemotaxis protein